MRIFIGVMIMGLLVMPVAGQELPQPNNTTADQAVDYEKRLTELTQQLETLAQANAALTQQVKVLQSRPPAPVDPKRIRDDFYKWCADVGMKFRMLTIVAPPGGASPTREVQCN